MQDGVVAWGCAYLHAVLHLLMLKPDLDGVAPGIPAQLRRRYHRLTMLLAGVAPGGESCTIRTQWKKGVV
jgi:hypothetical protein